MSPSISSTFLGNVALTKATCIPVISGSSINSGNSNFSLVIWNEHVSIIYFKKNNKNKLMTMGTLNNREWYLFITDLL